MSSAMSYPPEQRYLVTKQGVLGMARGLRFIEDQKYRFCLSKTRPVNSLFSGANAVWGNYVLDCFFSKLNLLYVGVDAIWPSYFQVVMHSETSMF